jgi:poly-gamma-glutamate capsule biosynthesis protein CapA/YwtB (metallophosphatase superfamily)
MSQKISPRIDVEDIGWCSPNCLIWRSNGLHVACHYSAYGSHICIPWLRERMAEIVRLRKELAAAAPDHAAMEEVRATDYMGSLDGVISSKDDGSNHKYWCWSLDYSSITFEAADPRDAILKAAEAAEKGAEG